MPTMPLSTLAVAAAVLGASVAQADDRPLPGSVALSYVRLTHHDEDQTYGTGGSLSLAYRPLGPLALVGEAARSGRLGVDVSLADRVSVRGAAELALVFRHDRFGEAYREELSSIRLGLAFHWGG